MFDRWRMIDDCLYAHFFFSFHSYLRTVCAMFLLVLPITSSAIGYLKYARAVQSFVNVCIRTHTRSGGLTNIIWLKTPQLTADHRRVNFIFYLSLCFWPITRYLRSKFYNNLKLITNWKVNISLLFSNNLQDLFSKRFPLLIVSRMCNEVVGSIEFMATKQIKWHKKRNEKERKWVVEMK